MFTNRSVPADLENLLIENKPFSYAHLIKFERPSRPDASGRVSTSKERYAYLTDGSREISFDDLSLDALNVSNGPQTYIANKVIKVGPISEQTEARASTVSLVLDGNGIGSIAQATITITPINSTTWDLIWPTDVDLVQKGFREGDKVTLSGGALGSGDFNIQNFRANNTLRLSKIDSVLIAGTGSVEMTLSSEEIKSILLDKRNPEYASFVNREVFIYRAYFNEGQLVGAPILLFKGIISNVNFDETENNIQVTWGLTSHWGDFAQVKGRITSDDFHRALDQSGIPQPQSALKPSYAYDKGFNHAETSLNLLASYSVQVEKQDITVKKGFLGIGSKVKVRKYTVNEERNTELDFQLQAKSIPVVYGVRNVTGIPIFADTLVDNSSVVYTVHALSEGEIGGIYDVYVDGNSLICGDKGDFDARSTQTSENTVDLVCYGRADRGDVLGGVTSTSGNPINYYDDQEYLYELGYNYTMYSNYVPYTEPTAPVTDNLGKGIIDGESIALTSPQSITIDFFSGKSGQKAASSLVDLARAGKFKVQNLYWMGTETAEYWGPNHRLMDTAYVVTKYGIKEGETSIPQLEFVVRGKNINAYNYDYSYSHYSKEVSESSDNFNLGDLVSIRDMSGNTLNSDVQIVDKWTFCNPDGSLNTRFRFDQAPNLAYFSTAIPSITKFYMQNSSGDTWTMVTWNYEEWRGTVGAELIAEIESVSQENGYIAFNYSGADLTQGDPTQNYTPALSFTGYDDLVYEQQLFGSERILNGRDGSELGSYVTNISANPTTWELANQAAAANTNLTSRNTVQLAPSASSVDGYYDGYEITVYQRDPITDQQIIQTNIIKSYIGSSRIAVIDDIWNLEATPKTNDVVVIRPPYTDKRVSINPAIQTLDYITATTYGKGLDPIKDLDLWSWTASARVCDTQSNITVKSPNVTDVDVGQVFRYPATSNGPLLWQGTVVLSDPYYTEFSAVIGKLSNAWNNWKSWALNELVYTQNRLYKVVVPGVKLNQPSHSSGTVDGLEVVTALQLEGSNNQVIDLVVDGNPVRAEKNGIRVSGYSLYDCDEVNYWRYLGWDEFSQRYVTKHQTNLVIDTSLPLFDNINSLLEHFGGILHYSGGKYYLDVEQEAGTIIETDTEVRNISNDYIMGKIRLTDEGTRNSYNSLTAAFADPGNRFEAKNISFFNSNYLRADRNVPRKGNLSIPGITNYYNTRILADKYLVKSRFGLTVSFNMAPRGVLLLAGSVIQLQYPKYSWANKKFRILNLTHQEDCTVDIVAQEYDDSFYTLTRLSRQPGTGLSTTGTVTAVGAPNSLQTTGVNTNDEAYSSIEVTWENDPNADISNNVSTELYSSSSPHFDLVVTTIYDGEFITSINHGLRVDDSVVAMKTSHGLEEGKTYYIVSSMAPNKFRLSETKGGNLVTEINDFNIILPLRTANLIATLPTPINSYIDTVPIEDRVSKFYWVRHKVTR